MARAVGNPTQIATALNELGECHLYSGAFALAEEYFRECLGLQRALGDIYGIAQALAGLGSIAIGIASGILVKGLLFGATRNPFKKIAGVIIQSVITIFAGQHSEYIKQISQKIIHAASTKLKSARRDYSDGAMYEKPLN